MSVTIVQLPLAALQALSAGDLAGATAASPAPMSAWLAGPDCQGTWRYRAEQVASVPRDEDWVTGIVVADGAAVGRAGFHAAPDDGGVVEVGYAIDPRHRRRGYAQAALGVLLDRARESPDVRQVLASVGPWNGPSLTMVRRRGFVQTGEQEDDEDGLELVFALDVAARPVGATSTRLVLIRGHPGSGTSAAAGALHQARPRDLARVSQDLLHREVLRARDAVGGVSVDLIDQTARFALQRGLHVVLDGILDASRYGAMLRCLVRDHAGNSHAYLLGGPEVPGLDEVEIGAGSTAGATLARIRADTEL